MLRLEEELEKRYRNLFVAVCEELAQKRPDKEDFCLAMQREATDYKNFPIVDNLCYLAITYYDDLDDETIREFVKVRAF